MTIDQCITVYLMTYSFDNSGWEPGEVELINSLAVLYSPEDPLGLGTMWGKMRARYTEKYGGPDGK